MPYTNRYGQLQNNFEEVQNTNRARRGLPPIAVPPAPQFQQEQQPMGAGQFSNPLFQGNQQQSQGQFQQQPQNVLGGQGYQQPNQQNPQDLAQQLAMLQQYVNPGGQGTINYQPPGQADEGFWKNLWNGVRNFTVGEPGQALQFPNYTPIQQGGLNKLLLQGLQNSDFGGIENRARQDFQTKTLPSIAERFTSMGAGNRGSSAFAGQLGAAASDLESQLGALRGQYGLQQLQYGLRPQFENAYIPRSGGLLQALPNAAAMYFGAGR